MGIYEDLQPLLDEPQEALAYEYKSWLNFDETKDRATFAKAANALANHGGGHIILGMRQNGNKIGSSARPAGFREITQDDANAAIKRFLTPEFHCSLYMIAHPDTKVEHPIVSIPGNLAVPVLTKRMCEGVFDLHVCFIRKPGPRSEPPTTEEEWRALFNKCILAQREELLKNIRIILSGDVSSAEKKNERNAHEELEKFSESAAARWQELTNPLPLDSPSRFPHGFYEMAIFLEGADRVGTLNELSDRLNEARRIRYTGWTPFLHMNRPDWTPYPNDDKLEAWLGNPIEGVEKDWSQRDPSLCDFWQVSQSGMMFTRRGYAEDSLRYGRPGTLFDIGIPIWRVAEALLFAQRFANTFATVDSITIRGRFTGLAGRSLISMHGGLVEHYDAYRCKMNEKIVFGGASTRIVAENLIEFVHGILAPLHECFSLFRLERSLVEQEINRMMAGNH